MPQQKLTIVPVKLHHIHNENTSTSNPVVVSSNPTCLIKTGYAEFSSTTALMSALSSRS